MQTNNPSENKPESLVYDPHLLYLAEQYWITTGAFLSAVHIAEVAKTEAIIDDLRTLRDVMAHRDKTEGGDDVAQEGKE